MSTLAKPTAPPHSVLYIEDNATNLALVEHLLARRGDLMMLSATTGHQGIEMACEHLPAVILMDIQLPDMSGLDALKFLRDHPATAHIPVMALSSEAFPLQIKRGIEAGFFRYLTKPFKIDDFMGAIDACLATTTEKPLP